MTDAHPLDDTFEAERARLVGLAYRITGSRAEAEDVVQDAWLRWQGADRGSVDRPAAWLTTVTSRLALDRLKSARHLRETYVGPWLPEVVEVAPGPEEHLDLAESLTIGFLTVLERLDPVERVVFVLADVFRVPYEEIATVVDRSVAACRQVASRARRRVQEERPLFAPTDDEAWQVTAAFLTAVQTGDLAAVTAVLAPEVVMTSDGGADHHAARRDVLGPDRVGRFWINLATRAQPDDVLEPRLVNGQPAVVVHRGGGVDRVMVFSVVDGRIDRLWTVVNPDKFARLDDGPVR